MVAAIAAIIIVLDLLGFNIKVFGRDAVMTSPKTNEHPRRETRLWLALGLALISIFLSSVTAYHTYVASEFQGSHQTPESELEKVEGKHFLNETVDMDGRNFEDCTFDNVKLMFHGRKTMRVNHVVFSGTVVIATDRKASAAFTEILLTFGMLNPVAQFGEDPEKNTVWVSRNFAFPTQNPQQPPHTRANYLLPEPDIGYPVLPYKENEEPHVNLPFENGGDFPIREPMQGGKIVIVPANAVPTVFSRSGDKLDWLQDPGGVMNPHSGQNLYHTWIGPKLTSCNVLNLTKGDEALCLLGSAKWVDDTGHYKTDFVQCFMAQGKGDFNWHVGPENNRETKIP